MHNRMKIESKEPVKPNKSYMYLQCNGKYFGQQEEIRKYWVKRKK